MTEPEIEQGQVSASEEAETAPVSAKPTKRTAKKAPAKTARVRRTTAEIQADEIAELKRLLELAQARAQVAKVEVEEIKAAVPTLVPGKKHVYHFVDDGYTVLGKTWVRGEELVVKEGSEDWESLHDRYGNFVLDLSDYEQMERFDGTVFYREGPWPGLPFDPKNIYEPGQVDERGNAIVPSAEEIQALEKANKIRKR
jgi:hypothetical protein